MRPALVFLLFAVTVLVFSLPGVADAILRVDAPAPVRVLGAR